MAKVFIKNVTTESLSLDLKIGDVIIRETLGASQSVDVGDRVAIDDINESSAIKSLISASKITITSQSDADDVEADTKVMMVSCVGAPALAAAAGLVASTDWANGTKTIVAQPDVPRNITVALTDADNSCRGLLTITGKDAAGRTVVEQLRPDGTVGAKTLTGTKIFAKVDSIVAANCTGGVPATDVFVCGYGTVIGLPADIVNTAAVKNVYLAGVRIASPVVAAGLSVSGVDASAGTYNGTKLLFVWFNAGE
jgi:hypothetical protein